MSEEDVRQKILDIVGDIYHADSADYVGNGFDNFDGHTWNETKDLINKEFDDLTIDHPKSKLPQKVGEAWIEYVDSRQTGRGIDKLDMALVFLVRENCPDDNVQSWYTVTPGALAILADAYRYGWEAEPEAKWYVKAPKEWWEKPDIPEWMYLYNKRGVCSGFKLSRTAFTRAEINNYHFDSDIFTLVPVEDEK